VVPRKWAAFNPAKTEAVLFGINAQREKIPVAIGIHVAGTAVPFHVISRVK